MAGQNVEYVLSLKDLFSPGIKTAQKSAEELSLTMKELAGAAAGAFGALAGAEFIKSSVEAFNESDKSAAQLTASIANLGSQTKITKKALDEQAEAIMENSRFDDDEVTAAQSVLLTFRGISEELYTKSIPAIADFATKMGMDLRSATEIVGKAMNNPLMAARLLKAAHISLTESQSDTIKKMMEMNNVAGAQAVILDLIANNFKGAAAADAQTYSVQMMILAHEFQNVKEEIGEVVMKMVVSLKPAIKGFIQDAKDAVHWVKEHAYELKGLATVLAGAAVGWLAVTAVKKAGLVVDAAITLYMQLHSAYALANAAANGELTVSQWALNAAMDANPIGVVVIALAALAAGIYYLWQKSEVFRGTLYGIWEMMKGFFRFVMDVGGAVVGIISNIMNPEAWARGLTAIGDAFKNFHPMDDYHKGYASGVSAVRGQPKKAQPPGTPNPNGNGNGDGNGNAKKASDVTGTKSYNINISIGNLVNEFNVQTTTIKDGASRIKDLVTETLLSAVNDSQIVAER